MPEETRNVIDFDSFFAEPSGTFRYKGAVYPSFDPTDLEEEDFDYVVHVRERLESADGIKAQRRIIAEAIARMAPGAPVDELAAESFPKLLKSFQRLAGVRSEAGDDGASHDAERPTTAGQ